MRKTFTFIILIALLLTVGNNSIFCASNITLAKENNSVYDITMKRDLLCLMVGYPEYITSIESNNGYVYLLMKSGKKLIYDDKAIKNPQEKLVNPDLQDTLDQMYPLSPISSIVKENFDPGRIRSYGLLSEVYGNSKQVVLSKLIKVNVGYGNFQFNMNNGAAHSLQAVMREALPLSEKSQNVRKCLLPCSGTFNYRVISGTNRLSPHSFGIAIDLASDKRDYWKWASKEDGEKRLSSYPNELVKIFENNGFIWGGKWSHFDILHFEYRPEIILKARYFTNIIDSKKPWHEGAPKDQANIKNVIEKINELIR